PSSSSRPHSMSILLFPSPLPIFSLFFSSHRPPPRPPPFPYTPLFRSHHTRLYLQAAVCTGYHPACTGYYPPGKGQPPLHYRGAGDRKSTRLNSSHVKISYAVFCLKKKKKNKQTKQQNTIHKQKYITQY